VHSFKQYWDVLLVYLIPFGGGIPAGCLLAQSRGIEWPMMTLLYFISDIILAFTFEPLMLLFIHLGKRNELLSRIGAIMKMTVQKTIEHYGHSSGIFALIMFAFGVDPMTGRAAAVAAGHGFVVGWMIAIAGDMMYFALLMVSTLWVNSVVGNEKVTFFIILALMIFIPQIFKKIQNKFQKPTSGEIPHDQDQQR